MARVTCLGVACLAALSGCGGSDEAVISKTFALSFAAKVGDRPFSCTDTFDGVGTTASSVNALDFRMYVYDVRLVRGDGSEEPLALEQDGQWQRDKIAFLDFEDGTGSCETGSPETRTEVVGTAPAGDYAGVRFNVGLPPEMNHLDAATAPAPLNIPGMWWSWKGGYKFVRLDLVSTMNPTYFFHLVPRRRVMGPPRRRVMGPGGDAVIGLDHARDREACRGPRSRARSDRRRLSFRRVMGPPRRPGRSRAGSATLRSWQVHPAPGETRAPVDEGGRGTPIGARGQRRGPGLDVLAGAAAVIAACCVGGWVACCARAPARPWRSRRASA
ncbi:MbnP family copper-binding protein [Sorangium sp. So ce204]|uniref:MbnP family copper-binding protein n=1 Tax=Sorangium sp. So ce204 TaxID=3133288 RepID=UPI003F5DAB00